jgi:hypothetical protein
MSILSKLKKQYIGNFYVKCTENEGLSIYRVEQVIYKNKPGHYDLSCVHIYFGGSPSKCIDKFYFSWEEEEFSIDYFKRKTKRCSQKWVKTMCDIFHNDLNNFANKRQYWYRR